MTSISCLTVKLEPVEPEGRVGSMVRAKRKACAFTFRKGSPSQGCKRWER